MRACRRAPLVVAALLAAAIPFAAIPFAGAEAANSGGPSVLVRLTPLRRGSLPQIVTVYGRIESEPAARHAVTAPAAAVVDAIDVRPGQLVAAAAPLIRLGPSPAAAAAYAQARAALRVGDDLVRRTKSLLGQHLATAQELAAAEKSQADAQATLAALTAEGAGGPQVLRAPFTGVVNAVTTSPGALVAAGAVLADLARSGAVVLRVGAIASAAARIRPGDPVAVTALGGPAGAGTVLQRSSMVDPHTGLVPVIISLEDGPFLAGETAEARIVTGRIGGYLVPHRAVLVDDSGAPYIVQAQNRIAHLVPVAILGSARDLDIVAGHLDPAAAVVLDGNYQLEDGMRIRVSGTAPGPLK